MGFFIVGCGLATPVTQPTQFEQLPPIATHTPTSIDIPALVPSTTMTLPIETEIYLSPTSIPTIVQTPLNTLVPEKANEKIRLFLREPVDCSAPCFWGIIPGQTTVDEVRNIFSHFGIQTKIVTNKDKQFYNFNYDLNSGLSIKIVLSILRNIVQTTTVTLVPDLQKVGNTREWLAYSPETLIKRYGMPSRIDFVADWGPGPFFSMQMYFDSVDLIIQYAGDNVLPNKKGSSQICPLTDQFNSVRLWMGKNPLYPPGKGVPLEKATSMTMEEFSKLMTSESNNACFILVEDVFP